MTRLLRPWCVDAAANASGLPMTPATRPVRRSRRRGTPFSRPDPDSGCHLGFRRWTAVRSPDSPQQRTHKTPCQRGSKAFRRGRCWIVALTKPLVDAHLGRGGAGGNRTPVHQSVGGTATTIPDLEPDASSLAGQLPITSGGPRIVFPNCQRSFSPSVVFPTVIPHFCCRAVMDWPRAALLLTMSLVSPEDQAARANCSLAILWFAPFNESEQLGSQTRPSDLTSKPVSPLNGM